MKLKSIIESSKLSVYNLVKARNSYAHASNTEYELELVCSQSSELVRVMKSCKTVK